MFSACSRFGALGAVQKHCPSIYWHQTLPGLVLVVVLVVVGRGGRGWVLVQLYKTYM